MSHRGVAQGLLLFWSLWLSLVTASNAADALQQLGILSPEWPYASGNFELVRRTVQVYGLGDVFAALLFAGVVAAEATAAGLFWGAFLARDAGSRRAHPAFALGIALFAAFLVSDELFLVYARLPGIATTHLLVLCALLLSYLAVCRR